MTELALLAAAASAPSRLDPIQLFLDADIVVQVVMAGLLLASVWVWTIVISFRLRIGGIRRRCARFEEDFWSADQPEKLITAQGIKSTPSAAVASEGFTEYTKSTANKDFDREGTRERIARAMESHASFEADNLAGRLGFLATTGAVAPFVGLFGTVWGIMNSFFQIGQQANSSLAVVAPGISEALFATAIGLFAAIPAVIAYNHFSNRVNAIEAHLLRFSDRYQAYLSRELEKL